MASKMVRPNVKLPEGTPPLDLAPDPLSDRIGMVSWWVCMALVAGFWYMVWELAF